MEKLVEGAYVRGHLKNIMMRLTHTAQALRIIDHEGNPVMPADWDCYLRHSTALVQFTLHKLEAPSSPISNDIFVADIDMIRVVMPSQTTNWREKMGKARPRYKIREHKF